MNNKWLLPLLACLTLGLAPFRPEPHLFGKIRWVLGGAEGMQLMDWWDLIMHGFPFVWLAIVLIGMVMPSKSNEEKTPKK